MNKYLAMDIGGTFIKYAVMEEDLSIRYEDMVSTRKDPKAFLTQVIDIIRGIEAPIQGIAICMGGFIDPVTGENTDYSVGENFRTYNLKKELEQVTGLPVLVENDSNSAAFGELIKGAGRGCSNLCMITFGTGIGGAVILDGSLYRGRNFKAGEVGFMRVGLMDEGLGFQAAGAGATHTLAHQVTEHLGKEVNGAYVFEHLHEPEIEEIYRKWLWKAAMVVGNMAVTLDTEKVLIGGGISENKRFISDLRDTVYQIYSPLEEYTEIAPCEKGNMAGRIGALSLLLLQLGKADSQTEGGPENEGS